MNDFPVVIVTGAARGIGFGIGGCFARKGYAVVVADLDQAKCDAAAREIEKLGPAPALGVQVNVTDYADVYAMVDTVMAKYGRIDALVNNAGICAYKHVMEMDEATWKRTIDVNLNGPFYCTQAVAKQMIANKIKGSIVFITSLSDMLTSAGQVEYAASKSGLKMAMAGFACALGPHGINSNAVAPGAIRTDMTKAAWDMPENQARIPKLIPLARLATPEDIGNACVFLCSPEGAYISGHTLRVDGGISVVSP